MGATNAYAADAEFKRLIEEFYRVQDHPNAEKMLELLSNMSQEEWDLFEENVDTQRLKNDIKDYLSRSKPKAPTIAPKDSLIDSQTRLLANGGKTGFPPDYPIASGGNYRVLIQRAVSAGLIPSLPIDQYNFTRCDAEALAGKLTEIFIAQGVSDGLAATCGGLAGVPIAEGAACAAAAAAQGTANAFVNEFNDCDFHIGNIDSAEIEAAYENTVSLLNETHEIGDGVNSLEVKTDALEGKADTLQGSVDSLEAKADALEGKADKLQSSVDALESKADALEGKADKLQSSVDALEGKADVLESKADALEVKADTIDEKLTRCEAEITANEQSLRGGNSGNFEFFLLTTQYGDRVLSDGLTIWIGSAIVIPVIEETLIVGVQRIELDKESVPAGKAVPLTVEVESAEGGGCSAISMIQRGNP
jgi:chaperonin cofactor prefoldin